MVNNSVLMADVIYDVDLAIVFKNFILSNSDDISFDSLDLKAKILNKNNGDLIRVGKLINSPTNIVSVDDIDAAFFKNNLYKKDGNQN